MPVGPTGVVSLQLDYFPLALAWSWERSGLTRSLHGIKEWSGALESGTVGKLLT